MNDLLSKTLKTIAVFLLIALPCTALSAQSQLGVQLKTVVIDPGHGGKDPGAINGKYREKDVTLSVALKLGKMIQTAYPSIKVIYTRSDDRFVPVYMRAEIANKNHADLFISIHLNSAKNTSAKGSETFVMGLDKSNSNMEVCQLENNVVVLEDDYSSRYEGFDPKNPESYIIFSLLQNSHQEQSLILASMIQDHFKNGPITHNRGIKQDVFLVLWKCSMPSVLTELGFLSNPTDCRELVNQTNQQKMATSLFKAFEKYKRQYETEIEISEERSAVKPSTDVVATIAGGHFRIQIMAVKKKLKKSSREFKGLECRFIQSGNMYKYTYGEYSSRGDAEKELPKIKKLFPQAFIINVKEP